MLIPYCLLASVLNISGASKQLPVVRLYTIGKFVLKPPGSDTQNVTFNVTNPATGTVKVSGWTSFTGLYLTRNKHYDKQRKSQCIRNSIKHLLKHCMVLKNKYVGYASVTFDPIAGGCLIIGGFHRCSGVC